MLNLTREIEALFLWPNEPTFIESGVTGLRGLRATIREPRYGNIAKAVLPFSALFVSSKDTIKDIDNIKEMEELQMSEKAVKISVLSKIEGIPVSTIHSWTDKGFRGKKLAYKRVGNLKKIDPIKFKTFLSEIQK